MRIVTKNQRSNEWYRSRLGCITGSNAYKIIGGPKAKQTYMHELAAESLSNRVNASDNGNPPASCRWGQDYEPIALDAYSKLHPKFIISTTGFALHDTIDGAGCSVDALTADRVIEIKCPYNPGNHIAHIRGMIRKEYIAQVQFEMWITGRNRADFVSYDPRFHESLRLHVKQIKIDNEVIDKFETEVPKLLSTLDEILFQITSR